MGSCIVESMKLRHCVGTGISLAVTFGEGPFRLVQRQKTSVFPRQKCLSPGHWKDVFHCVGTGVSMAVIFGEGPFRLVLG